MADKTCMRGGGVDLRCVIGMELREFIAFSSYFSAFSVLRLAAETPLLRRRLSRRSEELGHPQQRVTAYRECGHEADLLPTHDLHFAHRSSILAPTEALLDALSDPLAGEVARMTGGARVNRRAALLAHVHRHMRGHAPLAAGSHKVGRVI